MTTTSSPAIRPTSDPADTSTDAHERRVWRAIRRKSFAVLSTVSEAGFPHAAGILYESVGSRLYLAAHRSSRKVRNVEANDRVAMSIPLRQLPVGPPFNIHFQGRATILAVDDPEITGLHGEKKLSSITSHGELDDPESCFLRIEPVRRIHTYGLGVSPLALMRDPLHGDRSIEVR